MDVPIRETFQFRVDSRKTIPSFPSSRDERDVGKSFEFNLVKTPAIPYSSSLDIGLSCIRLCKHAREEGVIRYGAKEQREGKVEVEGPRKLYSPPLCSSRALTFPLLFGRAITSRLLCSNISPILSFVAQPLTKLQPNRKSCPAKNFPGFFSPSSFLENIADEYTDRGKKRTKGGGRGFSMKFNEAEVSRIEINVMETTRGN